MEVDRVSQIGGVGRDGVPAWPTGQVRRRKFVEEIAEPESEAAEDGSDEEASAESNESDGRTLDLMV
ncbi:MAG TPA: hypothetical protein VHX60_18110 [Acidobacteriaceae bacterium]|jgi:hypothetical protein|nr:hypothetical protein [Acidobacteriaceae bacterium]